ncbi:MAG: T9SS type A sorting domain-containing protein [Bacteroidota bacterium]
MSNITNTSPGIFTINNGSTINITGYRSYITNSGTFYAGTSNSACTINVSGKGNSLSPYSITNSGTFYLGSTSAINLTGTDSSNPTNLVNTGTFTFQSDANGSAILGQLGSGSSTVGNYNVQRYLTGGNVKYRSYRLLSSPVNSSGNIDLSYIGANATIGGTTYYGALTAGPSGGGFTVTNANPTLYLYDESRASNNSTFTSGKNIGVVAVAGTNVSTLTGTTVAAGKTIPVGNGFMFYFIGNNQSSSTASNRVPENTTITAIGTINQQDVPVKLWNTGTTGLYLTNNLVGNPYPSTIDLNQVYSDNYNLTTNPISPIFYELSNINPGQSYGIYNGALFTSSGNASRFIASGQGFFATVTANNQTITFKEDQKATTQLTGATLLMSTPENKLAVNSLIVPGSSDVIGSSFASQGNNAISGLHISMIQDTSVFDICGIYFMDGGIDKFDRNDGKDLDGISPKIYMSSYTTDGVRTGLNTMGSYIKGKKVKLYVKATTDGVYKLNLTDIQNIDITNYNLYLKDHYTKDSLDLSHNSSYSFRINNSDTTTFGANRFELVIAPKPLPPYALTSFTAKKVNEGVLLTWQTANEGNYTGFTLQKQNGNQFTALNNLQSNGAGTYTYIDHNPTTGTNAYRLMQSGLEANISYSETISVLYNTNSLNLYPNPAKDDINIYVNAPTTDNNPAYQMSIYDSSGTLILTKQINKAYTHNVATLRIGTYIVQVTDNNGKLIGNNKFSKIQ